MRYVSCQHVMERLLNVLTETVGIIATAVMHIVVVNYHQKTCPLCFLALDKDIPESSTRDEHRVGHCIFKDRIKRVLLYQVSNIQDKGEYARKLFEGRLRDNEVCGMDKWERT